MENSAILLRRLNPYCARAMEGAASLCQTRAHAEILPEHWLLKLLEQGEGDLTVLARRYEWDMDQLWQDLLAWLDKQPRSVRQRPQLSDAIQTLMQEAWLIASLNGEEQIRSIHLLMALVYKQKLVRCDGLWPLLTLGQSQLERLRPLLDGQSDERPEVQQEAGLAQNHGGDVEFVGRPVDAELNVGELNLALQNALDKFTLDVTAKAKEGKIDPVFGRDTEIRQMVDILSRRRKNNPILVGEPGVGKTALVEGLALRIAEGNVPESLKPVILRTLDLGLLQAGAGVKGEFEQRLKNVIDAVQQSPVPVLLFIDEAHTIIGAGNHLWLDLQWYIHQALVKSGQDVLADIIAADLKGLLRRLTGLETLAFNDGTPFADEVTLNWINQSVLDDMSGWRDEPVSAIRTGDNDILALEPEALEKADSEGLDVTLHWLQTRPRADSAKDKWLLRLLMARVAEQKGKNELALHLLGELDGAAQSITLAQWTPELLFEVKSRRLRLLRMKATRSETDKSRFQPEMERLLAGLIALDPAGSAVLCG
ncbi:type VI secretion system domain-containing protein [Pantoea agglomerans]